MQLTKTERLILSNQFKILGKVDPDYLDKYCQEACEILEEGFTTEYPRLFENIDDEMPHDECQEVIDILNMYRALKKALAKLPSVDPARAQFPGFDGNEESRQLAYTTFMIETQGKWQESKSNELNSHWPMLPQYRGMIARWKQRTKGRSKFDLTTEDVAAILQE